MRVSFKTKCGERVSFTSKKRRAKTPKQLRPYQFKAGSRHLSACLRKARTKLKRMGWRFS